jgi:flagellar hook-associated protein 1 FlgK
MASDLLNIGTSGLLAQQKMLATTSSNISNVSTQGYTRQSTVLYSNQNTLGVGDSFTRRLYSTYAQSQLWQDTATYNQTNTTYSELSQLDKYLSNSATSLADGIDSFFSSLQSANSSPNTTAGRQNIMTQLSSLTSRFNSVSSDLASQYDGVNSKISTSVEDINAKLASISDLNAQILKAPTADDDGTKANLLDQRDELVRQLSEKLEIKTVNQDNGTVQINLTTGQSLVLPGSYASLSVVNGDPDPQNIGIQLKLGQATTMLPNGSFGGELGGYFASRDTISATQNELGQLSLAFADAMNTQNKLGMTLNNELGKDLFSLPSSSGMAYSSNTGTAGVTASVSSGNAKNLTPNNFEVTYTATGVDISILDGNTKTSVYNNAVASYPATIDLANYGLTLDLSAGANPDDKFLIQPTHNAALTISTVTSRPEDLAMASPLQLKSDSNNYSSATIKLDKISDSSSFTSSTLLTSAPHKIVINDTSGYDIYDGSSPSVKLGTAPSGSNIMSNAIFTNPAYDPGFELSISGKVTPGDVFYISFNTNGFSDNTNGLALAGLQTSDMVRKGNSSAVDNKMTFNEAFSSTLTSVGTKVSSYKTSTAAADAKLKQSQELHESVAGVNLDEEASNLIRYQQAYAASAKVITAARDTFDALLSAVR